MALRHCGQSRTRRSWSGRIILACLSFQAAGIACADEPAKPPASARLQGLQVQPGDEPLKAFEPARPESAQEYSRRAAMALYMKGRIAQEHGRFGDALEAYLAAVEKDPLAIAAYKGALPILLQRQEIEKARKLTLSAAEKDPEGYELVMAMAAVFARQDQLHEGIQLLQSALKLPNLKPHSLEDLYLRRDLGLYYRLQGNYQKSAEEYKIVFDAVTDPALDPEVRKKLLSDPGQTFDEFGDVFLKSEQPELALKAFGEASKHREAKPGLHSFNLATVFRQTGKPQQALEELQHYFDAQMQTRGRAAYELLRDLLVELKKQDELLPRLEAMHKQDEHNDVLRYFLADETLAANNVPRASDLYTNGRENISDPRALVGMFSVYRQQRQAEKLLTVMTKAFSTVPRADEQAALQQMAPDVRELATRFEKEIKAFEEDEEAFSAVTKYARTLEEGDEPKLEFLQAYLLGKLATENNHTEDAIHFYKYAISMRNDPPAQLYTELAGQLIDTQHYKEAAELLNEAINHTSTGLQREKWRLLYLLSYAQAFQGQTEAAVESIHEAQKLQPNVSALHQQEAWILYHARRWDEALALYEQVINNYSGDKEVATKCRFHISNIYVEKGDMPRGEQILEDILTEDPDNVQANNDLGYLYADQGKNLERAETMIRKALQQEPENYAYLDSLGWVLYKQGKYEQALEQMEKATTLKHGDDSTIVEHLADCLEKVGRHDEAVAAWQRALKNEESKTPPSDRVLKSLKGKLMIENKTASPEKATAPK
ncbi:tetratricopeptide repeat protein [Planctomicrobium piriforme]|uniref:Tetratricopeptide repeat-containing protein n=1 Tax=Planctomicrobium piriforme TaxID=1576369 RepID=A0A1I3BHW3_9PLAN|nr:tetratricopeptide repeat protein [Planctomicrobium piriforme]SFH61895.1 Tetratricopeptide repeat-containing protein [Planctomicrobium piriforme]